MVIRSSAGLQSVKPFPECAYLERVGRPRCEVLDRNGRFGVGSHYRREIDSGACGWNRCIPKLVASRFDRLDRHQEFPGVTLIDLQDRGYGDRQVRQARRDSYEGAGHKRLRVTLAGDLDVVSERTHHDDWVRAALLALRDGILSPIQSEIGRAHV